MAPFIRINLNHANKNHYSYSQNIIFTCKPSLRIIMRNIMKIMVFSRVNFLVTICVLVNLHNMINVYKHVRIYRSNCIFIKRKTKNFANYFIYIFIFFKNKVKYSHIFFELTNTKYKNFHKL
ncbi:hypothetical protein EDEG_03664 [Edhazardia aedis USNM 41457]|uniref:Uncharacterized protein n=1 Tax=Edhazardia aedis (strain USNM 41457) TaxID=1003232 RepID=J9DGY4_EDHAE|nr:hypothetical protein EDEG_03664 [Edhazardia aedis USNM 41457]|eukprot:EJW01865.1 hypothetical protein EDEG_03664 [Edhazardia aedis USNM 41457]